jgi:hypothetical protein
MVFNGINQTLMKSLKNLYPMEPTIFLRTGTEREPHPVVYLRVSTYLTDGVSFRS